MRARTGSCFFFTGVKGIGRLAAFREAMPIGPRKEIPQGPFIILPSMSVCGLKRGPDANSANCWVDTRTLPPCCSVGTLKKNSPWDDMGRYQRGIVHTLYCSSRGA
jgi:hypothetical protein